MTAWQKLFLVENSEVLIFAVSLVLEGKTERKEKAYIGSAQDFKLAYLKMLVSLKKYKIFFLVISTLIL